MWLIYMFLLSNFMWFSMSFVWVSTNTKTHFVCFSALFRLKFSQSNILSFHYNFHLVFTGLQASAILTLVNKLWLLSILIWNILWYLSYPTLSFSIGRFPITAEMRNVNCFKIVWITLWQIVQHMTILWSKYNFSLMFLYCVTFCFAGHWGLLDLNIE